MLLKKGRFKKILLINLQLASSESVDKENQQPYQRLLRYLLMNVQEPNSKKLVSLSPASHLQQ